MSITTEQAIKRISIYLKADNDRYKQAVAKGYYAAAATHKRDAKIHQMAITALREKADREDPKPLTLDEALSAEEPIWVQLIDGTDADWGAVCEGFRPDTIVRKWIGTDEEDWISKAEYGKTWVAYRHKPREV